MILDKLRITILVFQTDIAIVSRFWTDN